MQINIVTTKDNGDVLSQQLHAKINAAQLPLAINILKLDKVTNKALKSLGLDNPTIIAEFDAQQKIIAHLYQNFTHTNDAQQPMKVALNWHKLQRRVVTAGKKSELLLQACKLIPESRVVDATAGFGHDSLILASTLKKSHSSVTLIEQSPIMALLLTLERERMSTEKNWQGLMCKLDIKCDNSVDWLSQIQTNVDVVYLDPMFPNDSYVGAKVGKEMQLLHQLAYPPTEIEEKALLNAAKSALVDGGRVVVKRPKNAPFLADIEPDESWQNDVLRFDGYFN